MSSSRRRHLCAGVFLLTVGLLGVSRPGVGPIGPDESVTTWIAEHRNHALGTAISVLSFLFGPAAVIVDCAGRGCTCGTRSHSRARAGRRGRCRGSRWCHRDRRTLCLLAASTDELPARDERDDGLVSVRERHGHHRTGGDHRPRGNHRRRTPGPPMGDRTGCDDQSPGCGRPPLPRRPFVHRCTRRIRGGSGRIFGDAFCRGRRTG